MQTGTGESEFSGLLTKSKKIAKTQTWQIELPGNKIDLSSGIKQQQQQDIYCKHWHAANKTVVDFTSPHLYKKSDGKLISPQYYYDKLQHKLHPTSILSALNINGILYVSFYLLIVAIS